MYQPEQKELFISDYLHSKIVSESMVRAVFNYISKFEHNYKKDVVYFTKEEIIEMLKKKRSRSITSLYNFTIVLKHYTEFIIGNRLENVQSNNFNLINKTILDACVDKEKRNNMFLSRDDIDNIKAQMYNATDKAILECLFVGISGQNLEDLTGLCLEQLDIKNMCINFKDGRRFNINKELCDLLLECFAETEMVSYSGNMTVTKVDGYGRLYKEKHNAWKIPNADRKYRWVLRRIVIWREYFNLPVLTAKTIGNSGLIHEVKSSMEKTNLPLRDFLKTKEGEMIARERGFKSEDYVDVLFAIISDYI